MEALKPSVAFAWTLVAFAVGVIAEELLGLELWITGTLLLSAGVCLFFLRKKQKGLVWYILILLIAASIGMVRIAFALPVPDGRHLVSFHGQRVEVIGEIVDVRIDAYKQKYIIAAQEPGRGRVYAAMRDSRFALGETVRVRCVLNQPEQFTDDFNFPGWLAAKRVFTLCKDAQPVSDVLEKRISWRGAVGRMRSRLIERVNATVPQPTAALAIAFLIGEEKDLPTQLVADFRAAGLSHIIAVSGYQVTLFATIILWLLTALTVPRKARVVMTFVFLSFFVFMAAAQAGVVRAVIMAGIASGIREIGRAGHTRNALLLAGAVMVFANPFILLYDVSFQLSFAATWGLVDLEPRLRARAPQLFSWLGEGSTTIAAILAVTPLALYHFGRFSLYAPVANILALPLVAVFTILSVPLVLFALFAAPAAALLGNGMNIIAEAFSIISSTTAQLPHAALNVPVWAGIALLAAALLFLPRSATVPSS